MIAASRPPVIFFDGVCNLCNGFVNFLIHISAANKILFAPLQGTTAKESLSEKQRQLDSVVFLKNQITFEKSDAIIMIFQDLGGLWSLIGIFNFVPKKIRDLVYDQISQNRYSIFGKKESCPLPDPVLEKRFLP